MQSLPISKREFFHRKLVAVKDAENKAMEDAAKGKGSHSPSQGLKMEDAMARRAQLIHGASGRRF